MKNEFLCLEDIFLFGGYTTELSTIRHSRTRGPFRGYESTTDTFTRTTPSTGGGIRSQRPMTSASVGRVRKRLVCELGRGQWPQHYPHENTTRAPRPDLACSEVLHQCFRLHRPPNPPRPDPLDEVLSSTENIAYLLQSLLPEVVWQALQSTTHRPDRAAASLQRAGLHLLRHIQSARGMYYHQILDHNPSGTARVYKYSTKGPSPPSQCIFMHLPLRTSNPLFVRR